MAPPKSLAWLEQHVHELAAVMVEPVQSRRPGFQPRQFLRGSARADRESRDRIDLR